MLSISVALLLACAHVVSGTGDPILLGTFE